MDIQYTITQLRQRAGLSQKVIADAIGCSQPNVSGMEAGKSGMKRPSFEMVSNLQALAQKHGVPTDPSLDLARPPDGDTPSTT